MQRRTFLQGLIALAVAMHVPLRPTQAMPTVTLGGDGHGWIEWDTRDGVVYYAQGIGDIVYVDYIADGHAHSKIIRGDAEWRDHLTA